MNILLLFCAFMPVLYAFYRIKNSSKIQALSCASNVIREPAKQDNSKNSAWKGFRRREISSIDFDIPQYPSFTYAGSKKKIRNRINSKDYEVLREVIILYSGTDTHHKGLDFLHSLRHSIFSEKSFFTALRSVIGEEYDSRECLLYSNFICSEKRFHGYENYEYVYRYEYIFLLPDNSFNIIYKNEYSQTFDRN